MFTNIKWNILKFIDDFITANANIKVYITIHDYQWLFEDKIAYTANSSAQSDIAYIQNLQTYYDTNTCNNVLQLFGKAHCILMPSQRLYHNYVKQFMKLPSTDPICQKIHVVPHNDNVVRMDQLCVPLVNHAHVINIAFIGDFTTYKGCELFTELMNSLDVFTHMSHTYSIKYHVYGHYGLKVDESIAYPHVCFHGPYDDDTLIETLYKNNIHIQTSLSIVEETYSYSLTKLINSGLPLVYLNRGALTTRLNPAYVRLFPFQEAIYAELKVQIEKAMMYVIANQGDQDIIEIDSSIVANEGYLKLYKA
jgi:hypothetical protein